MWRDRFNHWLLMVECDSRLLSSLLSSGGGGGGSGDGGGGMVDSSNPLFRGLVFWQSTATLKLPRAPPRVALSA